MNEVIQYLNSLGHASLDVFWFPLGIWTICCGLTFLILRNIESLNPLFHYHLRAAALISLPFGIGAAAFLNQIPVLFDGSSIETALFVVQNPIQLTVTTNSASAASAIDWSSPNLYIGIITIVLGFVSLIMLLKLLKNYLTLKALYKNLSISNLQDVPSFVTNKQHIKLAFHDHPLVPFTFGWKQPVIVLPEILKHKPEKMEMALQHELTHIKRGDYLLQLSLSMIESLFWFHPLIRHGNQEIDAYREISCDQEVLSKSDFSIKSYANLLYELVPLRNDMGRLSVSMAVQHSTLTKRIKTMNNHKLYRTSFRQSIALLLLMIVGITLPIACSDLRGPQNLSEEELENMQINIQEPSISINGIELDDNYLKNVSTGGLGAVLIVAGEYGTFKVAPRNFDGAVQAGKISNNTLSFKINELNVKLSSASEILKGINNSSLWVSHNKEIAESATKYPPLILEIENALAEMPNFPPPPPSQSEVVHEEDEGDYFVVVEEMPKLIGGMKSIQSKIEYPQMAQQAGIEGRVTVQFIVNENGDVENAKVVRGIGGGADEEALRVIREAKFEPGIQRGQPVRVQYAMSINFTLEDSDFSTTETDTPQPIPDVQNQN